MCIASKDLRWVDNPIDPPDGFLAGCLTGARIADWLNDRIQEGLSDMEIGRLVEQKVYEAIGP